MNADERQKLIARKKEPPEPPRKLRLWCKDDWKEFEVVRVPVEALLLNVDNRRFAAERKLMEDQLGRALDPENSPEDELSIISILLDSDIKVDGNHVVGNDSKDYTALKKDWEARGQESPFWIRPDGAVRNGNRRLAMLKRLRALEGAEGREYVEAVILDPNKVGEEDLFEMEQREQLTENLKVRYTDINLLLALRDAAIQKGIDWGDTESIEQVAGELQHIAGGTQAYAAIQLRAIRYMDAYLADLNADTQYHKLIRQVERFRDVGKMMVKIEEDYPDDAQDMLMLAFAAIRAGNPHGDIRVLRKIFVDDRNRYKKLLKTVEKEEKTWEETNEKGLAQPVVAIGPDEKEEEEEDDEDTPGPAVPNYPRDQVKLAIKNAIDGYASSRLDVVPILEQIVNRVESLGANEDRLKEELAGENGERVRDAILRIDAWVTESRRLLPASKK